MLNNSAAAITNHGAHDEPHNNPILTLKTILSPPGLIYPPGYTSIESADGKLGLEQVIRFLQILLSDPEKE